MGRGISVLGFCSQFSCALAATNPRPLELGSLDFTMLLPCGVRTFRDSRAPALVDVLHDFLLGVTGLLDDVVVGHAGLGGCPAAVKRHSVME